MTELLLGIGLRQFSMRPAQILPIKERLFETIDRKAVGWPAACCASPTR
jgi:phosphoenolpyruvate-protein kinase (PTS system EI component)